MGLDVLIVEDEPVLGNAWREHLVASGACVRLVHNQEDAIAAIQAHDPDVIILDLVLQDGSALAVSDFASYRAPKARVIFVTDTSFFSDGSIFNLAANARGFVPSSIRPDDLTAMVEHYAEDD